MDFLFLLLIINRYGTVLRLMENDKGLYATMNRWRIDPSSCLDTCRVDNIT